MVLCSCYFFVISLTIFEGRSVIFTGAPIASLCAGTSRVTIAPAATSAPSLCNHREAGWHRTNCYAIPYLRPLMSANTLRRVPVVDQYGIGPDKKT